MIDIFLFLLRFKGKEIRILVKKINMHKSYQIRHVDSGGSGRGKDYNGKNINKGASARRRDFCI